MAAILAKDRFLPRQFASQGDVAESFTFSAPTAIATSYAPEATAYAACRNASDPVAQKFSTRVTGLPSSASGLASVMPLMPDCAVPSQYASMSSFVAPALPKVSVAASISSSSTPLSQCSVNLVHPMPTIATRSRKP